MNTPSNSGGGGGSASIRGFLVQTMVALLDIAQATPPFRDITMEPNEGQDQFDFTWSDASGHFAVQVKSSVNQFSLPDATKWATALQQARSTAQSKAQCKLILVGHFHTRMENVTQISTPHGEVAVEQKNLDLHGLLREAAHLLGEFMDTHRLHSGSAAQRLLTVKSLIGQMLLGSTHSASMSRDEFIAFLISCIGKAAQQVMPHDIDRIIRYAPQYLLGREADTAILTSAWQQACAGENPRPHILSFVALGGEGKTALVADWTAQLLAQDFPGCEAVFAWSFYSQGSEQQIAASSDLFLSVGLTFFGDATLAATAASAVDKAKRLAALIGGQRTLLILDGLEPLQYAPTSTMKGALRDQAMAALLKALATQSKGLCVLTTRYSVPDLSGLSRYGSVQEHALLRLPLDAGVALLRALHVRGAAGECAQLVREVQGHALTLTLLGSYLHDAHDGDIRQRDRIAFSEADKEEQGGHAWRVMDAYADWFERGGAASNAASNAADRQRGQIALALLRLLGLFDRPADVGCLAALWQGPVIPGLTDALDGVSEAQRNICLTRLEQTKLLTLNRDGGGRLVTVDAHPLLRAYFAQRLSSDQPDAWQAAHRRLYTYLCENTKDKKESTVDDLQPLYQAVAHGCLAGMQREACEEVYHARIGRRDEYYSTNKLGAFGTDLGALACFFEPAWQRVSPALREDDQAWLLNEAAFRLRALGRLSEATEPMRAGLAMRVRQENWKEAARSTSNLSGLALTLGDLAGAVQYAEQAVSHADRSGDAFMRLAVRTNHATALHQAGQPGAASTLFCAAEVMQAEWQPHYPLLYSVRGLRYCDLLLAAPEAAGWQCSVQGAVDGDKLATMADSSATAQRSVPAATVPTRHSDVAGPMQTCNDVAQRAAQTLDWMVQENVDLLSIALNHLTLGRAALFGAIAGQPIAPCQSALQYAVDGLRRAGRSDYLPHGLLTRTWLRTHIGHHTGPDSAQTDLDEAWEIAVQGPMPLFLADIHLHRAGLFHHIKPYPWQLPADDAREARRLIEKHGYLRRMADLEVVEQAIVMKTLR